MSARSHVLEPGDLPGLEKHRIGCTVEQLCALGPRFVGTPGEARAQDFLFGEFAQAGLEAVRLEPVDVLAYRPEEARCEIDGSPESYSATGLQFTATGTVEAEAVYLGRANVRPESRPAIRDGVSIKNRIAVLTCPWPYLLADELVRLGAAGIVVLSEAPDGLAQHLTAQMYPPFRPPSFNGRPLPIPGVTVECEASHRLLAELTQRSCVVRLTHYANYVPYSTATIVGEIPGASDDQFAVIGAHYDTQLTCPGACDNAAGVASLLEIARSWRESDLARTAIFAAFADEEHGWAGATAFCRSRADHLGRIMGMVNLDALAWRYPAKHALTADPSIQHFALESARALDWTIEWELEASLYPASDHNAFIDSGVPACQVWRFPPPHPYYHTSGDTIDLLDFSFVAETASVASYIALRLATDPELDLGRSTPTVRWLGPSRDDSL